MEKLSHELKQGKWNFNRRRRFSIHTSNSAKQRQVDYHNFTEKDLVFPDVDHLWYIREDSLYLEDHANSREHKLKPRNETQFLHALFSKQGKATEHTPSRYKDITKAKKYPRSVVKMAEKSTLSHNLYIDNFNLAKGHEHQEMLNPRSDLTVMVQPSKIDYVGWKNNGGVRLFIHRPLTVPTDPRDSIEIDSNVEAFINLEQKNLDRLSGESIKDVRCIRRISQDNLWFDVEVEIAYFFNYTKESCIYEWQAKTMFKACKCLPHYFSEAFDYWWNKNLKCNHHGLKCMALINGKLFT